MPNYAIFRVGEKKYKDIKQLQGYQRHMERELPVSNSDRAIKNRRLIGTERIIENVQEYIKYIKLRKNNVLARDLLLTASPGWFESAPSWQKQKWVEMNVKWLKDNFRDNCVYATLHQDEKTWHISALIVPKFLDNKQRPILANARYFDGIQKMSAWQDNYANAMQEAFKDLNRGIKFSKAKHVQIRQFYTLVNKELDTSDIKSICSKTKNSDLLEIKIKSLQGTLNAYKDYNNKSAQERNEMQRIIKDLKKDNEGYKETIKALSEAYKIPQSTIKTVVDKVQEWASEKSLERKK